MILNTTDKPFFAFSAMQRLATHGETVVSQHVQNLDEFDAFYARYRNVASKVIVDDTDFILANDICNSVDCPVVTLDIENIIDRGTWEFREYNPDEE
ncbi:MAG: hypothetical protein GX025_10110 [Clostridiales bacterium]|nr:hypothetical protein [Clostridiales bacterium]